MTESSELESFAFTVGTVWREQRVSCPHTDLLRAFDSGSLPEGAVAFLRFHLQEAQCPYCNARLQDLQTTDAEASRQQLVDLRDRLLRSTARALRRVSG